MTSENIKRPIVVDLFSGAGGLSLGFEQAGFDVVAAVEVDPIHSAAHKFNFPNCTVFPESIRNLSGEGIRKKAGIGRRKVDVVAGGPPCQGFSLIGQRALDDPRNSLVGEFVRIVSELDASYFVFENVKGLTVGRHKMFLEEIIDSFVNLGYRVLAPWRVLNASCYGVPQDRERLFLLGAKQGLPLPEYPEPSTLSAGSTQRSLDLPFGPTCMEAMGDLPDAEKFGDLIDSDSTVTDRWARPSEYASEMRCATRTHWRFGYRRKWDPAVLTSSTRTVHSEISRRRFLETAPGSVEPISRFFRLPPNGVSNTLRAGTDAARGAFTSPRPIHFKYPRCITVREMARLHGFPDWFRFHETKWHGARQVGNAVPPPLARAVAESLVRAMGQNPFQPSETLDLGGAELLRMDMSQAANYWGIPVPIGKRDRKSGAKKRKQEEIESQRLAASGAKSYGKSA